MIWAVLGPRLCICLQALDRRLLAVWPTLGRYCWETVIVLEG